MMRAVRYTAYGGPEVLRYVEVPLPDLGPRDVLLRVAATSVNAFDVMMRSGFFFRNTPPGRGHFPLPFQLGREAAGEVARVGEQVTGFAVGDRVLQLICPACGQCENCRQGLDNLCLKARYPGHNRFGGYAQFVAVPEHELLAAPPNLPFEKLACLLWSYPTVWHALVVRARFGQLQDILITGASGGMGTAAIQLARLLGARRVLATSGSPQKASGLRSLGVDQVLDPDREDVPAAVRALTQGRGVDVVLDALGGPFLTLGMRCLRMNGTLVNLAELAGTRAELEIPVLFRMNLNVLGTRACTRAEQQLVVELAGAGRIDPVVSAVLPLERAADAHRMIERREQLGKVVLRP